MIVTNKYDGAHMLVTYAMARFTWREQRGDGQGFVEWLRQWWPYYYEPDAKLRDILGRAHPNVLHGDAVRASQEGKP